MLFLIWIVFCLAAAALILLPLFLRQRAIFQDYSGARPVTCPENHHPAAVNIDARHAASTAVDARPTLRLCDCTRWPERAHCNQGCISQALSTPPYTPPEKKPETKPIHHLPILLAAFTAWVLGALWHAQYTFRPRFTAAAGLTSDQVKQIVWWLSPHLLTAAICLLFAYGVASLLTISHRKGVLPGLAIALLLCAALIAGTWFSIPSLSPNLLKIEASYALLAALTIGSIVGGLSNKLVLPPQWR